MEAEQESDDERRARLKMEAITADLGRTIGRCLPPGVGFLMVTFDFGGKGNMAYVANGERSGVLEMLDELRHKLRGQ